MKNALAREYLSQQFARDWTQMILRDMQPDDELPSEAALARMFDVSRTVVREGIQEIGRMGLIRRRQGKRTTVAPRACRDLLNPKLLAALMITDDNAQAIFGDLFDVRILVECLAAAKAAARRTEEDLILLKQRLNAMQACLEDVDGFMQADLGYHEAIHAASHDLVVSSILRTIRDLLETSRTFTRQHPPALQGALSQHQATYSAIAGGDANAAHRAMCEHLNWSRGASVFKYRRNDEIG